MASFSTVGPALALAVWSTKTQAVVMQLQDWLRADRRAIFVVVLGVVGVWMVTNGLGKI